MQKSQQTSLDNKNFVGDVLSLIALSNFYHHWKMHKIKKVFVPPLQIGQFRIWYHNSQPCGFCSWAWVSDEVLERLQDGGYLLEPQDWQSGKNLWIADWISPFGRTREMVRSMRHYVTKTFGTNIKGQWFRPSKGKKGYAFSNKKIT